MASRGSDPSKWAIACWGCVLDALADFEKTAKSIQPAAAKAEALEESSDRLNDLTGEVVNTEGIPLSTWEHVVNKMKVPLIASQACCALLDTAPSIGIVYLDILATTFAYRKSMWAPLPDRDILTPTKISIAVTKQLEQSGVLNLLGRVFGMVADELQSHKPSAVTVLKMTNDQQPDQDDELHTHIGVIMHVQQVWDVYLALINMWPERQTALWKYPDIQESIMRLIVLSAQRVCEWVDMVPPNGAEPYRMLRDTLGQATYTLTRTVWRAFADTGFDRDPERERVEALAPLAGSPWYLQALCIGMTLAAYLNLLARKRAADGLHVSGSNPAELSSSGCGISTINKPRCQLLTQQALQLDDAAWEAAEVRSWQTACEQHAVLPDTHHKLLKAVGCSSKAVVWAAVSLHISTVEYQSKAANMWGLINAYQELVEVLDSGFAHRLATSLVQGQGLPRTDMEQLHLLLPSLLLHWAAFQPDMDYDGVGSASHAAEAARQALTGYRTAQAQHAMTRLMSLQSFATPTALPVAAVQEWLPLITHNMSRLLLEMRRRGRSGGSGSSSSSSSRCQSRPSPQQHVRDTVLQYIYLLLPLGSQTDNSAVELSWRQGDHDSSSSSRGSNGSSNHPWQQHATQLMALLESFVRLPEAVTETDGDYCVPTARVACLAGSVSKGDLNALTAAAAAAVVGSAEQQQVLGLLSSLLKCSCSLGPAQQTDAEECRLAAATAAAAFMLQHIKAATASQCRSSSSGSRSSAIGAGVLPWLVLFGRCCRLWAGQLQWLHIGLPGYPPAGSTKQAQVQPASIMGGIGVSNTNDVFFKWDVAGLEMGHGVFCELLGTVRDTVDHCSRSSELQQLGLQGFDWKGLGATILTSRLAALAAKGALGKTGGSYAQLSVGSLVKDLQELGFALTALPICCACNNPYCVNLDGVSEAKLVKGPSHACSACKIARYCSKDCQAKHWKQHKPVCKVLAAAAAAASGSDGSAQMGSG